MKRILFLCTGNYYRSRFAEMLFNHLAQQAGLAWRADSRGLRVQPDGVVNIGPVSVHTVAALAQRQIPVASLDRFPKQVTEADLAASDLVVAIKEAEHRPLMASLHPQFANTTRYWHVHDLDAAMPAEALAELEILVRALAAECNGTRIA